MACNKLVHFYLFVDTFFLIWGIGRMMNAMMDDKLGASESHLPKIDNDLFNSLSGKDSPLVGRA